MRRQVQGLEKPSEFPVYRHLRREEYPQTEGAGNRQKPERQRRRFHKILDRSQHTVPRAALVAGVTVGRIEPTFILKVGNARHNTFALIRMSELARDAIRIIVKV